MEQKFDILLLSLFHTKFLYYNPNSMTEYPNFPALNEDLNLNGYSREKISKELKKFINTYKFIVGRNEQIQFFRKVYKFLAKSHGLKFISECPLFENVLRNKLIEFRYGEDLREAGVWWRNIFKTRMPLKEDYS